MKWNKYSIQTTTEAVDFISSMLGELGIEGIEIEDNVQLTQEEAKTMFVDFIPIRTGLITGSSTGIPLSSVIYILNRHGSR